MQVRCTEDVLAGVEFRSAHSRRTLLPNFPSSVSRSFGGIASTKKNRFGECKRMYIYTVLI